VTEGNKIGAQLADLEAKRLDKRIEMEDLLQDLDLTAPPPAPAGKKAAAAPSAPTPEAAPSPPAPPTSAGPAPSGKKP
jgi:hypothetical protein